MVLCPDGYDLGDPALLHEVLCAGEGISLAMDQSMASDVKAGRLHRTMPEWSGPARDFNAFPRGAVGAPKVRVFTDSLRQRLEAR